jgi:RNA polymerase sigma-70 factor (ECF subfamily)
MRIAAGDEQAFEQLFETYGSLLHPFISKTVRSASAAEDILQRVFLKIWLKRDLLHDVDHPRAYLFKMASNECLAYLRGRAIARKHESEMMHQLEGAQDNNTENYLNIQEIKNLVQEAFAQLPPQQQRIYAMSRHEQLKIPEIADRLGLSPFTIKNSLGRSLQRIRIHLEKAGYLLPTLLIGMFL